MVWDGNAVKVGINAIGHVESGMAYDAINTTDAITVGFAQWYGSRAATILMRMKTENPSAWTGVLSSIDSDLGSHSSGSSWWASRHLTSSEGDSLKPVLLANKVIQDGQMGTDLAGYKNVAVNEGMNATTNTQSVLFFCTMYHQSPASALRVMRAATINGSLVRFRDAALADGTLGDYPGRQNEAYAIIAAMDAGSVGDPTDPTPPDPGTPGTGQLPNANSVRYVTVDGKLLTIHTVNGPIVCYLATTHRYLPQKGGKAINPVPTDPDLPPVDPGTGSPVNDYPFQTRPIGVASPYLFFYRECVDYCAWMVRSRTAYKTFTNSYGGTRWGNANGWDNAAARVGIVVNQTPAVGSVAFRNRGAYGHVAWVYRVNADGTYGTMEYNSLNDHEFHTYNPAVGSRFDGFIHFEI